MGHYQCSRNTSMVLNHSYEQLKTPTDVMNPMCRTGFDHHQMCWGDREWVYYISCVCTCTCNTGACLPLKDVSLNSVYSLPVTFYLFQVSPSPFNFQNKLLLLHIHVNVHLGLTCTMYNVQCIMYIVYTCIRTAVI